MLTTKDLEKKIKDKYLYLDNDFLSHIFNKESSFEEFVDFVKDKSPLLLTNVTKFEFLRDTWHPKTRIEMENFVNNPVFNPTVEHKDLYIKQEVLALKLSKIYSYHKNGTGASFADLLLASKLAYYHPHNNQYLITRNVKHFPSYIFDIIGTISFETVGKHKETLSYYVLGFNSENFKSTVEKIKEVDRKHKEELKNIEITEEKETLPPI